MALRRRWPPCPSCPQLIRPHVSVSYNLFAFSLLITGRARKLPGLLHCGPHNSLWLRLQVWVKGVSWSGVNGQKLNKVPWHPTLAVAHHFIP